MIKYKSLWILDKDKDGKTANLNFRIKWNSSKCIATFALGEKIEIAKWSQESQRCRSNTTHGKQAVPASYINRRITEYEEHAEVILTDADIDLSVDSFKAAFNKAIGKKVVEDNKDSLIVLYDNYCAITSQVNEWTDSTWKTHHTLKTNLIRYNKNMTIKDISLDTLYSLLAWYVENGYLNSTIRKQFIMLKSFISWLYEKELYLGEAHKKFVVRFKGACDTKTVVYLTWDELIKLYHLELEDKTQEHVRDVFCLCCFTSLRYSDVEKLTKYDIRENTIEVVTQKTNTAISIDLNNYSRALLNKYKNIHFHGNKAMPVYTMQAMNRELKKIGEIAGFNTPIRKVFFNGNKRIEVVKPKYEYMTTHCGRRTFIVNSLYLGIPAEVVMKWTGHSNYEAMKPYVDIVDELKSKEMDKFNKAPGIPKAD